MASPDHGRYANLLANAVTTIAEESAAAALGAAIMLVRRVISLALRSRWKAGYIRLAGQAETGQRHPH